MIKSFKIVNNIGESITLDIRKPENTGFLVSSVTGLTYPKADLSMSEIAMFDGATLTNRRVGARNIVMGIIFYDSNNDKNTIEELRHKCYQYFPIKQQVTFYVTNDSGTYSIKGYIESNEINIFSKMEASQISIVCPDPYFTKSNADSTDYVSGITPNFQFPVSFEFTGKDIGGYTKYDGPWVIVPKRYNQTLFTEKKYFYGDITVTKVNAERTGLTAGGYTVTIEGAQPSDQVLSIEEDEEMIFQMFDDSWEYDPKAEEVQIATAGFYTEQNIVVNKIPFSDTTELGMTTRTFGKLYGSSHNPFKYSDYTGSYYLEPGSESRTLQTAGHYLLADVIVRGITVSRDLNAYDGDTLDISIDRTAVADPLPYVNSNEASRYSGVVSITPAAGADVVLATESTYCDENITLEPYLIWEENMNEYPSDPENYTVYIGR